MPISQTSSLVVRRAALAATLALTAAGAACRDAAATRGGGTATTTAGGTAAAEAGGRQLGLMLESARHGRLQLPCLPIDSVGRARLTVGGRVPVTSCRWEDGDTISVLLQTADSAPMSLVRAWSPEQPLAEAFIDASARVERDWGTGTPCPQNDQKGVAGDRFWEKDGASVRLYAQLPGHLVLDYERGPGSCRPTS